MTPLPHTRRKRAAIITVVAATALGAAIWLTQSGRQGGAAAVRLDEPIAIDPRLRADTLANGLHYYIRPNASSVKRAELRLVVNAGSVLEDDDQRGLAHGVEHMVLRSTRHYPDDAIETYFESLGMRRGDGVNATTSMDETIYRMTVPVDRPGAVDTAFAMLADIAQNATFNEADSRNEAKVVLEEWRSDRDALQRIADGRHALIFAGTPYANRSAIGDTSVVRRFDVAAMRRFYDTWYRPDLMAVIAVGDIEVGDIEPVVKKYFGTMPRRANAHPRPPSLTPAVAKTLRASVLTDPEATDTWISFWYPHPPLPYKRRADHRSALIAALWRSVLRARLEDASAISQSPVVTTAVETRTLARPLDAEVVSAMAMKDRALATMETLATEIERLARYGVTQPELEERALAALRLARRATETGDISSDIAGALVDRFLTGNAVISNRANYELTRDLLPTITARDVSAYARARAADSASMLIAAATTDDSLAKGGDDLSARARATIARQIAPPPNEPNVSSLMGQDPQPGRVVNESTLTDVRAYDWMLSNGMRVILKPTGFTFDKIQFRMVAPGGASLASDTDYPSAFFADGIIGATGVGALTDRRLDRWLLSTSIEITLSVSNDAVAITGTTSSRDVRAFFQLVHLYLTAPRSDTVAFRRYRDRMQSIFRDRVRDPDAVFEDTLSAALSSNHPRLGKSITRFLEHGSLTTALHFWKQRTANGSGFVVVVTGDFTLDRIRPLVERYLASIPRGVPERPRDVGIPLVSAIVRREVDSGLSGSARAAIALSGPLPATYQSVEALNAVRDLLELTILQRLRDKLGGTYTVSVSLETSLAPPARYTLTVDFGAAPERVDELANAALQEIERLRLNGPTASEFERTKAARVRDYEGEIDENDYWTAELSAHARFGWPFAAITEHPREVERLTQDDLRAACATYIPRARYVRVVMRPQRRGTA